MSVRVDEASCTGCALCVVSCPEGAVDNRPSFIARVDEDSCTLCWICVDHCPTGAMAED